MRIEDARFGAEVIQQALGLQREEPRLAAFAQRTVEQEDTRRMGRGRGPKPVDCRQVQACAIDIGKIAQHQRFASATILGFSPRSYQPFERFTIQTTESITGTSISTPTTVASAAPD